MNCSDACFPKISPIGESALLLTLDEQISLAVNDRVMALDARIQANPLEGFLESVPAYASLLLIFDPLIVDFNRLADWLGEILPDVQVEPFRSPRKVVIPVHYGGDVGPDLGVVAEHCGLSKDEVVALHTAPTYRVGMMGFTPGFAYLMGLDKRLVTPRRATPRTLVRSGSIGIAGAQTGVYPLDSPGGWQLIGRTRRVLFDSQREMPFLLAPGDEVQFLPKNDEGL